MLKEEEKMQKEKDIEEQNKIFEQARIEMMEEQQKQNTDYQFLFENWTTSAYLYAITNQGLNDESINYLAKEKARKYMETKEYNGKTSFEDLWFTNKILMSSSESLFAKM